MTLDDLYAEYKGRKGTGRKAFDDLIRRFKEGRDKTFVEAAACSAAVMGLNLGEGFDPSSLSPQLEESFRLAFPNLNVEDIGNYSGERLEGLLQPWKGKLFEVLVRDRLNNGEWVGGYHLDAGQHAELAASATQPGWDIQILNSDESVADQVQLKATNYVGYVENARDQYPQFDVLATSELAPHVAAIDGLGASNISDAQLESQLIDAVSEADYGLLGLGLPLIPLALNVFWVGAGKRSVGEAAKSVAISTVAIASGHAGGEIAASAINEWAGGVVIDGIGSVILDVAVGLGTFYFVRKIWRWFTGPSDEELRKKAAREAQIRKEQMRLERMAIDSTCRHIDGIFESTAEALDRMARHYLPAPA